MDLINSTPFAADIFATTAGDDDYMLASVVTKASFRIHGNQLVDAPDAPWPITGDPVETAWGKFDGESPFVRDGVDLFVLGQAYPTRPGGTTGEVEIRVGSTFHRRIRATGDRRWLRRGTDIATSAPEPFEAIPLTWARAYGGKCLVEAGEFGFPANPEGRGFVRDADAALGQLLPNLEDPDHLIESWRDQPTPVGTGPYPRDWQLRMERAVDYDLGPPPVIREIKPAYFNNAHPDMIIPRAPVAGELVDLSGVRTGGERLRFAMPDVTLHVYVQLGCRRYVFPAHLDAILILSEEARVVIAWRCCIRYRLVPLERRAAVLRTGPAPAAPPETYVIAWDD